MKKMTLIATGDAFITRRFPEGGYEGFEQVRDVISQYANSHFLRTAGPHSPDSPGHIKRTVLEISRAERGLRPANQYRALSQKAMPSQSVR